MAKFIMQDGKRVLVAATNLDTPPTSDKTATDKAAKPAKPKAPKKDSK